MDDVIEFTPKSERERRHLIREAREIYDSIFPSRDPVSEPQDRILASHSVHGASGYRRDRFSLS